MSEIEQIYREHLQEDIIKHISSIKNVDLAQAMDIYYSSSIANSIFDGTFGIQYLDYKILADMIINNIQH